jgi:toxin ParE1/3/4
VIVVLTDEAALDLEQIGDAIARDNLERAVTYVRELPVSCESLGEFPKAYPWCRDTRISACGAASIKTT